MIPPGRRVTHSTIVWDGTNNNGTVQLLGNNSLRQALFIHNTSIWDLFLSDRFIVSHTDAFISILAGTTFTLLRKDWGDFVGIEFWGLNEMNVIEATITELFLVPLQV